MSGNKEKSPGAKLEESLVYKKENFFEISSEEKIEKAYEYAKSYAAFLDKAKTEREAVSQAIAYAESKGYTPYVFGETLKAGDKKYYSNRNKYFMMFKVGSEDMAENGVKILASHIDSPRLDIKQVPLYEEGGMAFLKTHYYGGIKKYQWTAIPLALHGTVVLENGETVNVVVGEDDSDPVFYINDLLPHLAREQVTKPLASGIDGETLNVLVGGLPFKDEDVKEKVKLTVLQKLNERYGMKETDFISAEFCAVPAFKARDIGFDRSLIGAYGHDDKVCSYPAITALGESKDTLHTVVVILADKEEIGSEGPTGMQCEIFSDLLDFLAASQNKPASLVRLNSKCLSADVTAGYDPNFANVFEKRNSSLVACGTALCKFTGAGGKSGSNDARAELVGEVRRAFDKAGVNWQMAELGKVDAGGGGTVAKYISKLNIDTIDIGVPVISMHAPYEVVSKADLYSTYEAFVAFIG